MPKRHVKKKDAHKPPNVPPRDFALCLVLGKCTVDARTAVEAHLLRAGGKERLRKWRE